MNSDTFDGLIAGLLLGFSLGVGGLIALARLEARRPSKQVRR
jgi:hypothetical protein